MSDMGYVYVLSTPDGYWKIGCTNNPKRRFTEISPALPFKVKQEFLFMCRLGTEEGAERLLHKKFEKRRMNGEWFQLEPEDVEWFYQNPLPLPVAVSHAQWFSLPDLNAMKDDALLQEMVGLS